MTKHNGTILVTGYPYAFPQYRNVFVHAGHRDRFFFALPGTWRSKSVITYRPDAEFPGTALRAWSYGRASLLGGLWKGWTPGLAWALPSFRMRYGVRVLYSCLEPNLLSTLYNALCAKACGCRHVIFTWQNVPSSQRLRGLKKTVSDWLVRMNLALADGIICGNREAERIVRDIRPQARTIVAPLAGVDTERFRPGDRTRVRQTLGFSPDEVVFLFYGALDERKGLDVLLRAFSRATIPNARLIIVGQGPLRASLEDLARELGASSCVTFIEWMKNEDLPGMLNVADVFMYPSVPYGGWEEQFGYAMAEAGACGIPVAATRSGSIADVVADGVTGVLVPSGDVSALADAMVRLAGDRELRATMGEAGRKRVEERFSHRAVAQALETFLASFL